MKTSSNLQSINQNSSEENELNLDEFEIQDRIFQTDESKYFLITKNSTKTEYLARSFLKPFKDLTNGDIINFYRGISNNSKIKHPSILNYYGYSLTNFKNKPKSVIITEYSSKYTLKTIINQIKKDEPISEWNDTKRLINIYGIASGISYLHSNNIIHRNLKPESVFLDKNFYPKITCFEYSKELQKNGFIDDYEVKGDMKYQPPEVLTELTYSKKSDVYSFSLLIYSIMTNNEPYQNLRRRTEIISSENKRPPFGVSIPKCYQDLIERCWSPEMKKRPTFDEIIDELKNNKEFITEKVNKNEFENYIRTIEESPKSFDLNCKKRKIKKKESHIYSIGNKKLEHNSKIQFDLTKYNFDQENIFTNEYKLMRDMQNGLSAQFYRKEINFFFRNEIVNFHSKLSIISQINHPSILKFYGYSPVNLNNEQKPVIVTEFLTSLVNSKDQRPIKKELLTKHLIAIYGIAFAMAFLHSHRIIHRDLKTSNIHLDVSNNPKLGGFDIAIELKDENDSIKSDTIKGTPAYLAPEVYRDKEYSRKSDVYSFAMIVYELFTGKKPFYKLSSPKQIKENLLIKKVRPTFSEPINITYKNLIERCWKEDPKERPTFDEILYELENNEDFLIDEIDKDYYFDYIEFVKESNISFKPDKRINIFDDIIEKKLHTYKEMVPCSDLSSIYDTELNDILFDSYDYIDTCQYKFIETIKHYFYKYKKVLNIETNENFMIKMPAKDIKLLSKSEVFNFAQELAIISQINHPSIIKFIGYELKLAKCEVVIEYSEIGTLDKLILNENSDLNDTKKLIIIYGIAAGMSYIHSHNILHRDLKTSNILLDNLMRPKISGFNISIEIQKNLTEKCDQIKGSPAYLAPEVYRDKEYSRKSDVYSFAMILYELFTGEKPFNAKMSPKQIKENLLIKKVRPTFSEPINMAYKNLIERCWKEDPKERPTFDEILHELKTNRDYLNQSINEIEYKKYIQFIDESKEISFNPSKRVSHFDIIIKNTLDDYYVNEDRINFRNIYETEYNNVLFEYDYIDLDEFELIDIYDQDEIFIQYNVEYIETGEEYLAFQYVEPFDELFEFGKYKDDNFQHINSMIGLSHPAILEFAGYSPIDFENGPHAVFIVRPSAGYSLNDFFNNYGIASEMKEKQLLLDDTKRLINIYGIASGLSYAHSLNRYHGYLRLEFIKLDMFLYPKICEKDDLLLDPPSKYDDIYDFALIVYTLVTNKLPEEFFKPSKLDETIPSCYRNLLLKCFNEIEEERPTFDEIVYHLKTNPEFLTDSIDKKEFQSYVKLLEIDEITESFINDFILSNNFSFRKVDLDVIKKKKKRRTQLTVDMGSIEISDYEKMDKIGKGNFGVVYTVFEKNTGNIYAAKKSKFSIDNCGINIITNLSREINIISILKHKCILRFIGFSPFNFKKTERKPVIITEYVPNGSLEDIINQERNGLAPKDWDDTKKLIVIYGIASGMKYIHGLDIIHCDLKPGNILLDESLYPKICDFGLSRNWIDVYPNKSFFFGTPAYCSPEVFKHRNYSKESDVYAFGMIVFQIITNEILFNNFHYYDLLMRVSDGYRPEFKYQIPYCYKNLIEKCWSQEPEKRPTFRKIVKLLENDSSFISPNIDDTEFKKYQLQINKNPNVMIHSLKNDEQKHLFSSLKPKQNKEVGNLFINLSKFEIDSVISKGKTFKICKFKEKETQLYYQGQMSMNSIGQISDEGYENLLNIIANIKELKHPSLLKFIGYSPIDFKKQRNPIIITEFPLNGSLLDLLELNNEIEEWNETKKLMNIYGIASALSYLHSNDIVHRSLNPSTIYLDDLLMPKIGDFGLSTLFDDSINITHQSLSQTKRDLIYFAPEVLVKNEYSKSSDVYAFAMIVFELITNEVPFDEVENESQIINLIINDHYRPKIKENVPKSYRNLIEKCWSQNPEERPNFDDIINQLSIDKGFITDQMNIDDYHRYIDFIHNPTNNMKNGISK